MTDKLYSSFEVGRDDSGQLNFVELPFDAKRLYWLTGPTEMRGGHAHKNLFQVFLCMKGNARVSISDGTTTHIVELRAGEGFKINPGLWRDVHPLLTGDLLLVAASEHFDEDDYIREKEVYLRWQRG